LDCLPLYFLQTEANSNDCPLLLFSVQYTWQLGLNWNRPRSNLVSISFSLVSSNSFEPFLVRLNTNTKHNYILGLIAMVPLKKLNDFCNLMASKSTFIYFIISSLQWDFAKSPIHCFLSRAKVTWSLLLGNYLSNGFAMLYLSA